MVGASGMFCEQQNVPGVISFFMISDMCHAILWTSITNGVDVSDGSINIEKFLLHTGTSNLTEEMGDCHCDVFNS
jgi:hypothetical protein